MKRMMLVSALLAVSAIAQDAQSSIPWGLTTLDDISYLFLPQAGPPQSIVSRDVEPVNSQGFMLTISSPRLATDVAAGARIKLKIYVTAVLKSGQYAFEYKEVSYRPKNDYPTTVLFTPGPTAKIVTVRVEETREHNLGGITSEPYTP